MGKFKDIFANRKLVIIIAVVVVVVTLCLSVAIACGVLFTPAKGDSSSYVYDKTKDFDIAKDGYVINKSDDKDFKVLNIADLQMSSMYSLSQNKRNYDLVKKLVEQEKPDLITFTGDNFWLYNAKAATKKFIKNIDALDVPWAAVFGNHEPESEVDKNWIIEQFLKAENCIFNYGENSKRTKDLAKGPNNIAGVGNYVINVLNSDSQIVHTIFMMDSHSNNSDQHPEYFNNKDAGKPIDGLDGWFTNNGYIYRPYNEEELSKDNTLTGYKAVGTNYDYIKQTQIEWYEWVVKGVQKLNNDVVVPSSTYFHIPLPEFNIAYAKYEKTLPEDYNGRDVIGADGNFGLNREEGTIICSPYYNSGFFDKMKELGSTKDVIVGHDHVNDSSIVYDGIRLTYGLKTGDGCYWDKSGMVSGGTTITIDNSGVTKTTHKYLPFEK